MGRLTVMDGVRLGIGMFIILPLILAGIALLVALLIAPLILMR